MLYTTPEHFTYLAGDMEIICGEWRIHVSTMEVPFYNLFPRREICSVESAYLFKQEMRQSCSTISARHCSD